MNVSEGEDGAKEPLEPVSGKDPAINRAEANLISGTKTFLASLIIALAVGVVTWFLADRFRVREVEDVDEFYGGVKLSVPLVTRNGVVSYATLGALLALGLGLTAGLANNRRSISRALLAGLTGAVLGAGAGAACSYVLFPVYFGRMESADLTLSILIHLGIWTAVGAASGVAFGIGCGSRDALLQSLIGGIIGAASGTLVYDLVGAFLPLAHTERPLAEVPGTRLAADLLLGFSVVVGIVVVTSQKPRVTANKS